MENQDDESNAKKSDSAYSNSSNNSNSQRSHGSTRSDSNSSGSSGYGGKKLVAGGSLGQQSKKEKVPKKIKLSAPTNLDVVMELETSSSKAVANLDESKEDFLVDVATSAPVQTAVENGEQNLDVVIAEIKTAKDKDGFSCVVSMHDGVIVYISPSLTAVLGFPSDMWIGRSFIDFFHPKDRDSFASQITKELAQFKMANNGTQDKAQAHSISTMVYRIRQYKGLFNGFGVKDLLANFQAFLLTLTFKTVECDVDRGIYLVIQASPLPIPYKIPFETFTDSKPFVIRHAANGTIQYVDPDIVAYTGYLTQDLVSTNMLLLYHPDDLSYMVEVYENLVKDGGLQKSKPYRMLIQNGHYVTVKTEWSAFINPWTKKLEFVMGKHNIIKGPGNINVFQDPKRDTGKFSEEEKYTVQKLILNIIKTLNEEKDSAILRGLSPHHVSSEGKSSPISYNELNYNETLHRYFESHQVIPGEDYFNKEDEGIFDSKTAGSVTNSCLTTMAHTTRDSSEASSSYDSNAPTYDSKSQVSADSYHPIHLTESILNKHNRYKEKELVNFAHASHSVKQERDVTSNETKQKNIEHLARCNAVYCSTSAAATSEHQKQGVKRSSNQIETEAHSSKHHCSATRQSGCGQLILPDLTRSQPDLTVTSLPYVVYGQPIYMSRFVFAPMIPAIRWPNLPLQTMLPNDTLHPLGLASNNYKETTRNVLAPTLEPLNTVNKENKVSSSEEQIDKTDGESSFSSFYSSFKTDSGSAEDIEEVKKAVVNKENVKVTSELRYKYQLRNKNLADVLIADQQKMNKFKQSSVVNNQLEQLYLDLQLQGAAARLSLEEGITSSSSSDEELFSNPTKTYRKNYKYSKLVMIYEEDAPLPTPILNGDIGLEAVSDA